MSNIDAPHLKMAKTILFKGCLTGETWKGWPKLQKTPFQGLTLFNAEIKINYVFSSFGNLI